LDQIKAFVKTHAKKSAAPIAAIVFCALLPVFITSQYYFIIFSLIGIYIIATSGLDLLFGYCGQISLGHAGFYCIGAYGTALLSKVLLINPWVTMPLAAAIAAIVAFLFALPTAKLKFMFLSLVTTAFGELIYQIVVNWRDVTGSTTGLPGIPKIDVFGTLVTTRSGFFYVVLAVTVVVLFVKQRVVHSRVGRAFIAIRESDVAAGAMGINVTKYKAVAFAISAFFTALAGALYAHMVGFISPESFARPLSLMMLTIVLFGGRGSFSGPIIGSIVLNFINEYVQAFGQYQQLFYGLFIVFVVFVMPGGLAGTFNNIKRFVIKRIRHVT